MVVKFSSLLPFGLFLSECLVYALDDYTLSFFLSLVDDFQKKHAVDVY